MFPPYAPFAQACRAGLSTLRPLRPDVAPDATGWEFGAGWPPSYSAYGRMRALLTVSDARRLQPRRVLELAAGDGALCACLAADGCETLANDLRAEGLRLAAQRFTNGDRIRVIPGNLFDLDPDFVGRSDLVIACEVIEHIAHTVPFLRQLHRLTAPGGRALVTTPNGAYFRNRLPTHGQIPDFTALEKDQFKPDADGHLFLITPAELADLARDAGFAVESMRVWATPWLTGHCRLAWLSHPLWTRWAYLMEVGAQRLPPGVRARLCFGLVAVLRAGTDAP